MAKFKKLALLFTAILVSSSMAIFSACVNIDSIYSSSSSGMPDAVTYSVKFVNEDGTVLQEGAVEEGQLPVYSGETPVKAGDAQYSYEFDGWDKPIVEASADAVYTAKYKAVVNNYTVTFDADGGSAVEAQTVPYGTPASGLEDYRSTKTGYEFKGWVLADGSAIPENATVTENITVKASWEVITYSAKVIRADESEETVEFTIENRAEKLAAIVLTANDDQYTYSWESELPSELALNNDHVFTEIRTVNTYTVTFTAGNGGTVDETEVTVPYGTAMNVSDNVITIGEVTVTATATAVGSYADCKFDGFTGITEIVTANTEVKANFKATTYLATESTLAWANFTGLDYSVVSMEGLVESDSNADISKKPVGAKADYNAVVSITPKDWAFNVGFDITNILANIDQYNNHYLTLYIASYFYSNASTGAHLTTLNATGEYVWGSGNANASSVMPLANFTAGSTAGWVALNIEMSAIKEMAQTNEGKNYIVYNFAPNKGTPVYIYSLEVTEKVTITAIEGYLPDDNCYYTAARTNTIKTVSMEGLVESDSNADISNKPANAKANYNACFSVTPGANMWETAIAFDITEILANIDQYEGKYLTLFAASYFYGARGAYLSGFNASQNKVIGISQAEYATGGMAFECISGSTNGWMEYKIPVSALKAAAENKPGANYITWHFRTNANTPVYIYSIEITD